MAEQLSTPDPAAMVARLRELAEQRWITIPRESRLFCEAADALTALAAERNRHDCERWALEGLGCKLCNPAAEESRAVRLQDAEQRLTALARAGRLARWLGETGKN